MKKLKLYLDTSVISHLDAKDVPEKEADTKILWEEVKAGKYDLVMSEVTYAEINKCMEPKQTFMRSMLAGVSSEYIEQSEDAEHLRDLYISVGGLPPRSLNDAMHIAMATVSGCDIVLSWNFKHMVNLRAMKAVEAVNVKEGYNVPRILSPSMMIDKEE